MFASEVRKSALHLLALFCLFNVSLAQLTYHIDANTNSFTLKTPELQQSFTRVYGAAPQHQQPQQQAQQQVQQPTAEPVQFSPLGANSPPYQQLATQQPYAGVQYAPPLQQPMYNQIPETAPQENAYQTPASYPQTMQQFQALQRQQQQQQQQQPQTPQLAQLQAAQMQYAEQLRAYYAQQQQQQQQQLFAQQQQVQLLKQLYAGRPNAGATTNLPEPQQPAGQQLTAEQYATYLNNQHLSQHKQQMALSEQQHPQYYTSPTPATHSTQSSTTGPRNGLQYSSADDVSHVKFQSGNLSYNF